MTSDIVLTINHRGGLVDVPAHCYAFAAPYLYVHLDDPERVHALASQTPVLLTASPERRAEWQFLDAAWGQLERVDELRMAPHAGKTEGHAVLWRVCVHGGGQAAVQWPAGGAGERRRLWPGH